MTGPQFLSDADMARYFIQATGQPRRGADPVDLEPRIEAWLKRSNLAHRRAFPIALEVAKIADAPDPLPTPEQAAWAVSQAEGIGDPQQLTKAELAARCHDMPMAEYARERVERLGMHKSTLDFLAGA